MKQLKLMLVCTLSLIFSCSSEEDTYDFTGVWNLDSVSVLNFELNNSGQYTLDGTVQSDENCLTNSSISIFPNNTALLRLTSKVEAIIQVIDGTTNELEQVLTCINQEEDLFLTWKTGSYSEQNEDGTVTTYSSNSNFESIRFLDENGEVVFSGFKTFGESIIISPTDFQENPIYVEVEGEEIVFNNISNMIFSR